jgi:low temperature requirement protein LtrA
VAEPDSPGKRVTWTELFFDLVLVLGITQVSTLLGEHHQWWGLGRAAVVLLPIYWIWVATSLQTNRLGADTRRDRIGLAALTFCGLLMAIAVPQAYGEDGLLFAFGYWFAVVILCVRYLPANPFHWRQPLAMSMMLTGPLLVVGALLPDTIRVWVWAVAVVADLVLSWILRRSLAPYHYDAGHLRERFGLFVLIALGESIIGIGLPLAGQTERITVLELLAVGTCFLLVCAMWWTYFADFHESIGTAVATAPIHISTVRHLEYGHLGLAGGIVMVGVGFEQLMTTPQAALTLTHLILLYGGTALFVACFVYMRWATLHILRAARAATSVLILALLAVAVLLPGLAAMLLLVIVVMALNAFEARWPGLSSLGTPLRGGTKSSSQRPSS